MADDFPNPSPRQDEQGWSPWRRLAFVSGPLLALVMVLSPAPSQMPLAAWHAAAIGLWVAIWWLTEAIPIAATALLPVLLGPLLGVSELKQAAQPYAHPLVLLFFGGFVIGIAIQRWRLHRRIALYIVGFTGDHPQLLIGGLMLGAALVSMWITNTATTLMMLPIGLALVEFQAARLPQGRDLRNFTLCVLLGIAYGATLGGISTIIGTAPNGFIVAFAQERYDIHIGFGQWLGIMAPVSAAFLLLAWLVLTRLVYPFHIAEMGQGEYVHRELKALGPFSREERAVAMVFAMTASLWVLRSLINRYLPQLHLTDTAVALAGALALFVWPRDWRRGEFLLAWEDLAALPWGVLILFGGGLSLADMVATSGLAAWIGGSLHLFAAAPPLVLLSMVVLIIVLLTELTSNTATAAVFLPVLGSLAVAGGYSPLVLIVPATLAASCAFMLPVATPPNAIVFGSGRIHMLEMARAGAWLNLVSLLLLTAACWWWVLPRFGVG